MRKRHLLALGLALCLTILMGGCGSIDKFEYFQDIEDGDTIGHFKPHYITFEPGDRLSIVVNSKDPKLAVLFNLPITSYRAGEASGNIGIGSNYQLSTYTIDGEGNIDFPIVGKLHLAGLNRGEVAEKVKNTLIERDLLKDPVVTVEYGNLYYYTLGEVGQGKHQINRDRITLVDAITENGGMTNYGLRDSVMVIRNDNGTKRIYNVDFTSYKDVVSSPAYYVKQNDVIYVKPNNTKKRQSTVNGNTVFTTSFWISLASLLTSMAVLIVR